MRAIKPDIVIAGAGPAGMMAAIRAGQLGRSVLLLERNPSCGRKLLLSGKGRCNLANACPREEFFSKFSGQGAFLRDALDKFYYPELTAFFEERGLEMSVERQGRIFPSCGGSADVLRVLLSEMDSLGVKINYNCRVRGIETGGGSVRRVILEDSGSIAAERVILACGGVSYAFTGSVGDGQEMARALGHTVSPLLPALAPLRTVKTYPALKGLLLKNVRVSVSFVNRGKKRRLDSPVGEVAFHSRGIGGALVLSLSGRVSRLLAEGARARLEIDLKPGLERGVLDSRLLREFKAGPHSGLEDILCALMPEQLAAVFCSVCGLPAGKKANQITAAERGRILDCLKCFFFDIEGVSMDEAMVTCGGVSLKQINPRTMESRLVKGLYFAGEMIDLDADTGGFNLQAAFSTGYLAGESAASRKTGETDGK